MRGKRSRPHHQFPFLRPACLLVVFVLSALPVKAQKQGEDCSHLVVNHTYVNAFNGFINLGAYFSGSGLGIAPDGGAGTLTFLPHGKVTNVETIAIGLIGLDQDLVITGDYSLSWDTTKTPVVCSGTITATGSVGGNTVPFTFSVVVTHEGQELEMIHTDPGLIVGVTLYPMSNSRCSNDAIDAKYSYNAKGWALNPPSGPFSFPPEQTLSAYVPFAFTGAMQFHPHIAPSGKDFPDAPAGSGSVEFWDTVSFNGQIVPRLGTGWYKINSNCTGSMVLRDNLGFPDFHLELFVGESGDTVYLANVDTATVPGPTPGSTMQIPASILGSTLNRLNNEKEHEQRNEQ